MGFTYLRYWNEGTFKAYLNLFNINAYFEHHPKTNILLVYVLGKGSYYFYGL